MVVGGGSGIGQAAAVGLASFGAKVYCADVNLDGANETVRQIAEQGGEGEAIFLDILDLDGIETAVSQIGSIDILVSTPSINVRKPMLETSSEEFERVIMLNLNGTFQLMTTVGRGMAERGRGSIIVFSSHSVAGCRA